MAMDWKNIAAVMSHPAMGRVVVIVNLVILTMLAHNLSQVTWRVLPSPPETAAPALALGATGVSSGAALASQANAVQQIAGWHLFGDAAKAPVVDVPPQSALPETKLNLVLRGVLAVADNRRAQAIIAQPNGDEQSYGVGDSLPGGAVLKEIKATSVILLRNHQFETLSLPKLDLSLGKGDNTAAVQSPSPDLRNMSLRQVRDTLLTNPQSLAGLIQTQPYMGQNGRLSGYRIEPGNDPALFQRYGLQPGDIVTAINGVPLTSTSNAFQILRGLQSRDNVRVKLLRNGMEQTVSLQIE